MLRGFSWKQGICCFSTVVPRHHASALIFRICLENQPTRLNRDNRRPVSYTHLDVYKRQVQHGVECRFNLVFTGDVLARDAEGAG